jgi:hypothetical protein
LPPSTLAASINREIAAAANQAALEEDFHRLAAAAATAAGRNASLEAENSGMRRTVEALTARLASLEAEVRWGCLHLMVRRETLVPTAGDGC